MTTAILSHLLFSLTLSVAHCPLFSGLNAADIYLKLHLVDPVLLNPGRFLKRGIFIIFDRLCFLSLITFNLVH